MYKVMICNAVPQNRNAGTLLPGTAVSSPRNIHISNLVSQPGETDGYSVSDHVRVLDRYLGQRKIDYVIANNGVVDLDVSDVYRTKEHKSVVELDRAEVEALGAEIIADDLIRIENGSIRHDEPKTAYLVFSWMMKR